MKIDKRGVDIFLDKFRELRLKIIRDSIKRQEKYLVELIREVARMGYPGMNVEENGTVICTRKYIKDLKKSEGKSIPEDQGEKLLGLLPGMIRSIKFRPDSILIRYKKIIMSLSCRCGCGENDGVCEHRFPDPVDMDANCGCEMCGFHGDYNLGSITMDLHSCDHGCDNLIFRNDGPFWHPHSCVDRCSATCWGREMSPHEYIMEGKIAELIFGMYAFLGTGNCGDPGNSVREDVLREMLIKRGKSGKRDKVVR